MIAAIAAKVGRCSTPATTAMYQAPTAATAVCRIGHRWPCTRCRARADHVGPHTRSTPALPGRYTPARRRHTGVTRTPTCWTWSRDPASPTSSPPPPPSPRPAHARPRSTILADLLRTLDADEVPICVGFLSGVPRQGRVGIGYSTIRGITPSPAGEATLTVADVDRGDLGDRGARPAAARRSAAASSWRGCCTAPPSPRPPSWWGCSPAGCGRARSPGSWPTRWPRPPGSAARSRGAR